MSDLVARRRAFRWGRIDCAMAAADAVLAVTGRDPLAEYRRTYRTAAEASRAVREISSDGSLLGAAQAVARDIGAPPIAPARARRGDVVLLELRRQTLGFVGDRGWVFAPGRKGWVRFPIVHATHAWRID